MNEAQNRMIYLLRQYADDLCTAPELVELLDIIKASQQDETLYSFLQDEWNTIQPATITKEPDWNSVYQSIITKPIIPIYRRKAFRWIAAALVVGVLATVAMRLIVGRDANKEQMEIATHDVPAPTNTRAVITLADGSKVYLDSAGNGVLAQQNNVSVVKEANGGIKYLSPAGGGAGGMSPSGGGGALASGEDYNTLFNPRGSKVISLTLSDGTRVWLNSESSLRYPASFASSASSAFRQVEITGEAYFEVKHNAKQPFKVHLPNGSIVEDIGTAFNINAYPDEEATKTTLIEGSIKISAPSADKNLRNQREKILKPGEQAVVTNKIDVNKDVDIDEVMAWKNNMFLFDNTGLSAIMKQIARWYDLTISYEGNIPGKKFGGGVSRNLPLSKVLELLEANGVHFKIEGKKITVSK